MGTGPGPDERSETRPVGTAFLDPELDPPFDVIEPQALRTCLVLSSPHSGSIYPARFLTSARLLG